MIDNQSILEKKIYRLQALCAAIILISTSFLLMGFTSQTKQKFSEIDVERINVVEKDGKLKMVISNKERQHPGTVDGITYNERKGERPAGMIFFSEKGDEIGGLIFDGDTGKGQGGSLTFDKFRGDQTVQFIQNEPTDGNYFAGLLMNDENISLPQ
jgi:stress response protein SCP2